MEVQNKILADVVEENQKMKEALKQIVKLARNAGMNTTPNIEMVATETLKQTERGTARGNCRNIHSDNSNNGSDPNDYREER